LSLSKKRLRSIALYIHRHGGLLAGDRRAGVAGHESGETPGWARRESSSRSIQHRAELQHCH